MPEREIMHLLGVVEERTRSIQADVAEIKGHQIQQNARTDKLEVWMNRIIGGAAFAIALSPLFIYEIRQELGSLF